MITTYAAQIHSAEPECGIVNRAASVVLETYCRQMIEPGLFAGAVSYTHAEIGAAYATAIGGTTNVSKY